MREVVVDAADAGLRLDRYLRKLLDDVPLGAIFKMLRTKRITVDGAKAEPSLRLQGGMRIALRVASKAVAEPEGTGDGESGEETPPSVPTRWQGPEPGVVHQDQHLLVVDKPPGMASQPGSGTRDDLTAWIRARLGMLFTPTFHPAPVHRIDRGTSGLVVIGTTPQGLRGGSELFRGKAVKKTYLAVVGGIAPEKGAVDEPLMPIEDSRPDGPKVKVDPAGQPAHTRFTRVATGAGNSLLRVSILTGRMHQIRAHLAHLGHPIVGDRRYGNRLDRGGRLMLHASELEFEHPVSGRRLHLRAPTPDTFQIRG